MADKKGKKSAKSGQGASGSGSARPPRPQPAIRRSSTTQLPPSYSGGASSVGAFRPAGPPPAGAGSRPASRAGQTPSRPVSRAGQIPSRPVSRAGQTPSTAVSQPPRPQSRQASRELSSGDLRAASRTSQRVHTTLAPQRGQTQTALDRPPGGTSYPPMSGSGGRGRTDVRTGAIGSPSQASLTRSQDRYGEGPRRTQAAASVAATAPVAAYPPGYIQQPPMPTTYGPTIRERMAIGNLTGTTAGSGSASTRRPSTVSSAETPSAGPAAARPPTYRSGPAPFPTQIGRLSTPASTPRSARPGYDQQPRFPDRTRAGLFPTIASTAIVDESTRRRNEETEARRQAEYRRLQREAAESAADAQRYQRTGEYPPQRGRALPQDYPPAQGNQGYQGSQQAAPNPYPLPPPVAAAAMLQAVAPAVSFEPRSTTQRRALDQARAHARPTAPLEPRDSDVFVGYRPGPEYATADDFRPAPDSQPPNPNYISEGPPIGVEGGPRKAVRELDGVEQQLEVNNLAIERADAAGDRALGERLRKQSDNLRSWRYRLREQRERDEKDPGAGGRPIPRDPAGRGSGGGIGDREGGAGGNQGAGDGLTAPARRSRAPVMTLEEVEYQLEENMLAIERAVDANDRALAEELRRERDQIRNRRNRLRKKAEQRKRDERDPDPGRRHGGGGGAAGAGRA